MKKINVLMLAGIMLFSLMVSGCSEAKVTETTEENETPKSSTIVSIEQGTPNANGNIDALYLFQAEGIEGELVVENEDILPKKSDDAATKLNIYHMNDLHGNVMSFHKNGDTHSVAQMKKIVDDAKTVKAEDEAILWISAADDHIGAKFDELLGQTAEEFEASVTYQAYSEAGVDMTTLGNHEFDKGTGVLNETINNNASFPVICSNIFDSKYDLNTSVAAISVVDGLRIGTIGLTVTNETKLETIEDPSVHGIDHMIALETLIPLLEEHVDTFVILSHIGYEGGDRYSITNGDGAIATRISELTEKPSIVVGGHTHAVLNQEGLQEENVYNGVAVLQAGQYGSYLGNAVLDVENSTTTAKLISMRSGKMDDTNSNPELEEHYDVTFQAEVIDPMVAAVDEKMNVNIATTDETKELSQEMNTIDRYTGESAMANYFNDAIVARSEGFPTGKVDFSVFNGTGIGGLPLNSDVSYATIYQLFPYADTISVVEVTGQEIKDIIENNAPRIINEEVLTVNGGNLDASGFIETGYINFSSGIRYEIKLGNTPSENKAQNITLNDVPIEEVLDETYKVAFSTYLAIGRGGWQGEPVLQGLPEDFIGYDLKTLCTESGLDLGLLLRAEITNYIIEDSNGSIGSDNGVIKDERVKIIK